MDVGNSIIIGLVILFVLVGLAFYYAPKSNLAFGVALVGAAILAIVVS